MTVLIMNIPVSQKFQIYLNLLTFPSVIPKISKISKIPKMKDLQDDFTCDLCDVHENDPASVGLRILNANKLRHFGGKTKFSGQIQTVNCPRDNSKVKSELSTPGRGRILVVDAGEDLTVAFLGDNIALQAVKNGWSGVIVLGAIRDCSAISKMPLGVMAMGSCPLRTVKKDLGVLGEPLSFFGVEVKPDEFMYVDDTGILAASTSLFVDGV